MDVLAAVVEVLKAEGLEVYLIGARAMAFYGVVRETRDWDLMIDAPYTPQLRDRLTRRLRELGLDVRWSWWGFSVEGPHGVHIDINYAALPVDDEFRRRANSYGIFKVPSVEDLVVMKLMGREKDLKDAVKLLRLVSDFEYLRRRAEEAGLLKELKKAAARAGVKI